VSNQSIARHNGNPSCIARSGADEVFETIIVGNVEACRTDAEIADDSGNTAAIVYEDQA
jgi:hypothetical protein